jgi:hypothetical protein
MLYELRALQERLEHGPVYPWFLLKTIGVDITVTNGVGTLPADWIIPSEHHPARFTKTEQPGVSFLDKRLLVSELDYKHSDTVDNSVWPKYYTIQNNSILVFPLTSGVFNQPYYAKQGRLNDDFTTFTSANEWFTQAGNLLAFGVAATLAGLVLKDNELSQRLDAEFTSTWKQIQHLTIAKEAENIQAEATLIPIKQDNYYAA